MGTLGKVEKIQGSEGRIRHSQEWWRKWNFCPVNPGTIYIISPGLLSFPHVYLAASRVWEF